MGFSTSRCITEYTTKEIGKWLSIKIKVWTIWNFEQNGFWSLAGSTGFLMWQPLSQKLNKALIKKFPIKYSDFPYWFYNSNNACVCYVQIMSVLVLLIYIFWQGGKKVENTSSSMHCTWHEKQAVFTLKKNCICLIQDINISDIFFKPHFLKSLQLPKHTMATFFKLVLWNFAWIPQLYTGCTKQNTTGFLLNSSGHKNAHDTRPISY